MNRGHNYEIEMSDFFERGDLELHLWLRHRRTRKLSYVVYRVHKSGVEEFKRQWKEGHIRDELLARFAKRGN